MKRLLLLALLLPSGCLSAWEREPLGIYPHAAAVLNGPPDYLVGFKFKFN